MYIADRFDDARDLAFVRSYDSRTARRQFQVSVALIVVLFAAAFSLGVMLDLGQWSSNTPPANRVHQSVVLDA